MLYFYSFSDSKFWVQAIVYFKVQYRKLQYSQIYGIYLAARQVQDWIKSTGSILEWITYYIAYLNIFESYMWLTLWLLSFVRSEFCSHCSARLHIFGTQLEGELSLPKYKLVVLDNVQFSCWLSYLSIEMMPISNKYSEKLTNNNFCKVVEYCIA